MNWHRPCGCFPTMRTILVELIVVLVILAILAAILVPALLGWIDEARNKQFVLDAKNVYVATQAVADEVYAQTGEIPAGFPDTSNVARIKKIADTDFASISVTDYNDRVEATNEAEIKAMKITDLVSNGGKCDAELKADGWDITNVRAS